MKYEVVLMITVLFENPLNLPVAHLIFVAFMMRRVT